jgi:ferredoxin-nitrite reductase
MREIEPKNAVNIVEAIQDLGLCSRGSGADNIRNVTGTPTAGIDPNELIDTRPYAREWHFHILNERALYGLPRKFNVGFDGAGRIAVLEDTNDIGFQAVEVKPGFGAEPGVWFRLALGGITGHKDFARDTGVIVRPNEATQVADAIVRVYIAHGDRTDRNKARLKYVLDAWGLEKYIAHVEEALGRKLTRSCGVRTLIAVPTSACTPRNNRVSTGSASSCRSRGSRQRKCVALRGSRKSPATAIYGLRSGKIF